MVSLYNILTDTEPPRARSGPSRPSSSAGGPPAAARCGGVTNPNEEHRDAVGRSEAQVGECIAHPGLSPLDLSTGACGAVLRSWFSLTPNVDVKGLNPLHRPRQSPFFSASPFCIVHSVRLFFGPLLPILGEFLHSVHRTLFALSWLWVSFAFSL